MEDQKGVECPENQALAEYMWKKMQEMTQNPKGLSENRQMILHRAYSSVCYSKIPIETIKEFSHIKGVQKWIIGLTQGFFSNSSGSPEHEDLPEKGKKINRTKHYMPQKNSVAYVLLITLYRGIASEKEFMRKQELIDEAEASGLSRAPIA
ncbi:Crossover junction endonuclease mus81 [Ancistrocladus abbreviatus]